MNKILKKALIEIAIAVFAGYILLYLPAPGAAPASTPSRWVEPRMIMVGMPGQLSQDVVAMEVSKHQTEGLGCADA